MEDRKGKRTFEETGCVLSYCWRSKGGHPAGDCPRMSQAHEQFPYSSFSAGWGWRWGRGCKVFPSLPWRRHHAQQLRAWVLKSALSVGLQTPESLDLATGLPSTSLPVSPPLASWFHRAEDTEPSMPFTCPFSPFPVLPRTKLPAISAFWAGILGLGGWGEGVSPQGVARCILEPVHWGNAPRPSAEL